MPADRTVLLSIDFEDWNQRALRDAGVDGWDTRYPAFVRQVEALLDLLDEIEAKATFFLLGMTAKNYPRLVEELLTRGHDTASHGFAHRRVYRQTPDEFRSDIEESVAVIKELTGRAPRGYRAPAFSVNRDTVWAYTILSELGFAWDSSQFDSPRVPRRLGPIPQSPYVLAAPGGGRLLELPLAILPVGRGRCLPLGGGTYWRFLPTAFVARALRRREEAATLYFHPFEFDPERLRADLPRGSSAQQRALAAYRFVRANPGRGRLRASLRRVARDFRLVSFEQEIDILRSRYGERTRSLSEEGELV
ncbi:MAG TPA: polysaccharide deacetylase family protein [Gaiellaceae bacterium]|nr:polysaccharide deacetylase family protein [Gaiellaceae bacterium]